MDTFADMDVAIVHDARDAEYIDGVPIKREPRDAYELDDYGVTGGGTGAAGDAYGFDDYGVIGGDAIGGDGGDGGDSPYGAPIKHDPDHYDGVGDLVDYKSDGDDGDDMVPPPPPPPMVVDTHVARTATVADPTRPGRKAPRMSAAAAERLLQANLAQAGPVTDAEIVRTYEGPYATSADLAASVAAGLSQAISAELLQYTAHEVLYRQQYGEVPDGLIEQGQSAAIDELNRTRKQRAGAGADVPGKPTYAEYMARDVDVDADDPDANNPMLAAFTRSIEELLATLPAQTLDALREASLVAPALEEITPQYARDFLRRPRLDAHERPCSAGEMCVFHFVGVRAPNAALNTHTTHRFTGRELLLPSEVASGQRPEHAGWCLLCWRRINSTTAYRALMARQRIDNALRHHCVRAGVAGGYSLDKCLPIAHGDHQNGVIAYQLEYSNDDYAYTIGESGDVTVVESDTLMHRTDFRSAVLKQAQRTTQHHL